MYNNKEVNFMIKLHSTEELFKFMTADCLSQLFPIIPLYYTVQKKNN